MSKPIHNPKILKNLLTQKVKGPREKPYECTDTSFNMDSMMEKCAYMMDEKLGSKLPNLATKDLSNVQKETTLRREENLELK